MLRIELLPVRLHLAVQQNQKIIIFIRQTPKVIIVAEKREYNIVIKKDGKFYVGYCLEIPQARGRDTKAEAIRDTKRAIKLCKAYLDVKRNASELVTVSL